MSDKRRFYSSPVVPIALGAVALAWVGFVGAVLMHPPEAPKTVAALPPLGALPPLAAPLPLTEAAPDSFGQMPVGREGSQEPEPAPRDQDRSRQATLESVPPVSTWITTPDKAPAQPARFDVNAPLPPPRPAELAPTAPTGDRWTAVYDISAHTVYLPDGRKLEAHSGLGDRLDDPRFVSERDRGPTPPGAYELTLRESLFHGVQALRLTPVGEGDVFGRSGLLAHPYMLGPSGDSNGCVSFKDYDAFLLAYQNGQVKRLIVVAQRAQEVALRGAAERLRRGPGD
jgi:type VI secretion system (T6SS) effector TldE1-like protein